MTSGRSQKESFSRENGGGNSHSQMWPIYRAMRRVFMPSWRQVQRGGFSRGCHRRRPPSCRVRGVHGRVPAGGSTRR